MACNSDFVQYIADQCSGAGEIAVKKMMGDYCIYCDGVLFGLICDNNFYLKEAYVAKPQVEHLKKLHPGTKVEVFKGMNHGQFLVDHPDEIAVRILGLIR